MLAWFECVPRLTLISQRVYTRYFIFLVIHGFFTGTLASGLIAAIPQALDNPKSIVQELANNLPKASIYFLTVRQCLQRVSLHSRTALSTSSRRVLAYVSPGRQWPS